jgi:hypothetical protein
MESTYQVVLQVLVEAGEGLESLEELLQVALVFFVS